MRNLSHAMKLRFAVIECLSKAHLLLAERKPNTYNLTLTLIQLWHYLWPWPQTNQTKLNWCPGKKISNFHDLAPMSLVRKPDLDLVEMYHHTKNEVFYVNCFKQYGLNRQTHTHAHTHRDRQTHRQTRWKKYLYRIRVRSEQKW